MKRSIRIAIYFTTITLFVGRNIAIGQNLSALEIMKKNDQQRKAKTEQLNLKMKLINKKGKTRIRNVTKLKKTDAEGNEKSLICFHSPADVKDIGSLTIEHTDRDDDQWLYVPALSKVRRISASSKSYNFVGTDFGYEDLKNEELEKYHYKLLNNNDIWREDDENILCNCCFFNWHSATAPGAAT